MISRFHVPEISRFNSGVPNVSYFKAHLLEVESLRSLKHLLNLPPKLILASLTLAYRGPTLAPRSGLLAPLVEQRVAGGVEIFDLYLVIVHTHGR